MSETDTHEGWSNRETWAANLWLANEEGLYRHVCGMALDALDEAQHEDHYEGLFSTSDIARRILADGLAGLFDGWSADIAEGDPSTATMILDIGSLYRVDWREIAEGWVADAIEGGWTEDPDEDEDEDDEQPTECRNHGLEDCTDPDCIRAAGGSVLAAELRQAEAWAR